MPYEPLGDDDKIKGIHLPPTFSVHKYASAVGALSAINSSQNLGLIRASSLQEGRTQSVSRMGRSFSVRMSEIGNMYV